MNRTIVQEIRFQYMHGGMHLRLLMINAGIYLLINLLFMLDTLFMTNGVFAEIVNSLFVLPHSVMDFLFRPWTLFTYMFAHFDLIHILGNMIFLYLGGNLFRHFLGEKRLFYTYLAGGIAGAAIQLIANETIPFFMERSSTGMIGASASVMAVFMAVSFYRPQTEVHLFGVFAVRLIVLALVFLGLDFINLTAHDNVGHLAHLGGALLGYLSIQQVHSPSNFMNRFEKFGERIYLIVAGKFRREPKMKVYRNPKPTGRAKSDADFLAEKKANQERIDAILDKISKKGYESLSKEEKQFLFNQKDHS
jgi:membrane associated rhomboid family serine protease